MPVPLTSFEALDKRWNISFSFNALCRMEEDFGQFTSDGLPMPSFQIIQRIFPSMTLEDALDSQRMLEATTEVRLVDFRRAFLMGLIEHHPEATLDQAGEIIEAVTIEKAGYYLRAAFGNDSGGGEPSSNPPPARRKR